jgi:hypothetical protein
MNLTQGFWGWIKCSAIHNVFFDSLEKIKCAAYGFVDTVSTEIGRGFLVR